MAVTLQLDRISKSFGAAKVLDEVTLDVQPGEFVSLVGASGCGKSTLLRIIAGLDAPDRGTVALGGREVNHLGPRARNVAMVFQNYALYPHMSAFDNIALPLTMTRLSLPERLPVIGRLSPRRARIAAEIAREVEAVAGQLRIEPLLKRKPAQLSGGQRQRVALARALVREPTLFMMDEPLSNLDAQLRVHMRDEIADLHARLGTTFIYVTHDQVEAMTMSSRVAMMEGGRIAQIGKPAELYQAPATLSVARFIGSPSINVLPAGIGADRRLVLAGRPLPLVVDGGGAKFSVGVRPEHVGLSPLLDGAPLIGRVRRSEHHGPERLVHVDLQSPASGTLTARVPESRRDLSALGPGALVAAALEFARAHVFDADGRRVSARVAAEAAPDRSLQSSGVAA